VGLSACAFTMLAMSLYATDGFAPIDLPRVIQAITTGIGFIGAGLIFKGDKGGIEGLTTAAGLLVVSAIGVAVGLQNYFLAISVTAFMLFVFIIFGMLEIKFFHK